VRAAVLKRLKRRTAVRSQRDDLAIEHDLFAFSRDPAAATVGYMRVKSLSFRDRSYTRLPSLMSSAR
jgi:hypothetical protein